jgi:hypothetical protein
MCEDVKGSWLTLGKLFKSIESAATQDSTRREPHLVKDLRHPVSLLPGERSSLVILVLAQWLPAY